MAKGNVLDELLVELKGDVSGLTSSLRVAEKEVERSTKSINVTLSGMGSAFVSLAKWAAAAGAAVAATGVAIGTVLTKRSLDAIDATAKLSDQLGIQTEKLIGLQHAADLAGIEAEGLGTALRFMLRGLEEAQGGTGAQADALKALGLNAAELRAMRPEEALGAIADRMNGLATASERNAAAMALFGRGGGPMLSLLREGSAGLRAAQEEAERLGLTISRLDAAQVEAANDAMTKMGAAATGLGNQLAVALAPAIGGVADALTNSTTNAAAFRETVSKVMAHVAKAIDGARYILQGFQVAWDALKVSATLLMLAGTSAFNVLARGLLYVGELLGNFGRAMSRTGEVIKETFVTGFKLAFSAVEKFASDAMNVFGRMLFKAAEGMTAAGIKGADSVRAASESIIAESGAMAIAADRRSKDAKTAWVNAAEDAAFAWSNILPKWEDTRIEGLDNLAAKYLEKLGDFAADMRQTLNTPFDGQAVRNWLEQVTAASQEAAARVAQASAQQLGPPSPAKLTDKQREEYEKKLEELRKYLSTERELEMQSYMEKSALLAELRKAEQVSEADERMLRERLEADHAKRLTEIHRKEAEERQRMHVVGINAVSNATVNLLQTLASMQDSSSKKAFERQKKLSMAAAIVSTAAGVAAAFRDVPYPYNFVAAAAVAAAGGAQIAKIASTSFGGGSGSVAAPGGGAAGAAEGAATGVTGAAREGQQVVVNIAGGDGARFTGREVRQIIDAIGAQLADGATIGSLRTA